MLQLYATSEIYGTNLSAVEAFRNWILFEILMALSSIGTTIVYVLIRTIDRGSLQFELVCDVQDET